MANVQIFGVKNSQATRAAERFFKERRAVIQLVDLKKKAIAAGEIKRFVERFGWNGLLDTEGKAYIDGGLKYLKLSEVELMQRIEREPSLLRLPLVRGGKLVTCLSAWRFAPPKGMKTRTGRLPIGRRMPSGPTCGPASSIFGGSTCPSSAVS
jgi:arsenate reductase